MQQQVNRLEDYYQYHLAMITVGDMDPAYPALLYLCDRYELNIEQRFWLAFLYAACYHVPTVYYIYNEFPDCENVDLGRMSRWWESNRSKVCFQSDRRWIRSRNQFVAMVTSYIVLLGGRSQEQTFFSLLKNNPEQTYHNVYKQMMNIKFMGRYSMFLYLESVAALTGFSMSPAGLDLSNSLSSRNGLCYALGYDNWLRGHDYGNEKFPQAAYGVLERGLKSIITELKRRRDDGTTDIWSVETSLCAYKKIHRGTRYLGYYIDRQHDEIKQMEKNVRAGVNWKPLWDFRQGHFMPEWLKELRLIGVANDPRRIRNDPDHWYRRPASYR